MISYSYRIRSILILTPNNFLSPYTGIYQPSSNPRSRRREEGEQLVGGVAIGGRSTRIIEEEVLWHTECAVRCNDGAPDEQARDDERGHRCEEEVRMRTDDEAEQRLAVGEGASEEHDGLVQGAEDVEEAPGAEDGEEDEEREGVGQERGGEGEGAHNGSSRGCVADALWCRIGSPVGRRPTDRAAPSTVSGPRASTVPSPSAGSRRGGRPAWLATRQRA
jgi:hypothetical protein